MVDHELLVFLALCSALALDSMSAEDDYEVLKLFFPVDPLMNCIVLKKWSLLPNGLRPFQDLLCSPEFRYY